MPRRATPKSSADPDAAAAAPQRATTVEAPPAAAAAPGRKPTAAPRVPTARRAATTAPAAVPVPTPGTKSASPPARATPRARTAQQASPAPAARAAGSTAAPARKPAARAAKALIADPVVPAVTEPVRQGPPRRTAQVKAVGALAPAVIPHEALRSPRRDRVLAWALGVSVLLHGVVLALHFKPFDPKPRDDRGPPLEVALVNAKTTAKPAKADVLAQANLDGGGNTDENRRAKTPLPVLPKPSSEREIAVATQRVEELEKKAVELLTALRQAPVPQSLPAPTEASEATKLPTATELMQRTLESMRLEAQIAKDMDAYQKRPKRRFIGARAEEYRFARYVEDWRLKIERVGNNNYPEAARQRKLYGNLLLSVSIRSDGSLENVEVLRTSGSRILDAAAVKIVEMSAPFAPFPPDIKRDTDVLAITRTWMFTKADSLESQ